jgi:hypothetical protein
MKRPRNGKRTRPGQLGGFLHPTRGVIAQESDAEDHPATSTRHTPSHNRSFPRQQAARAETGMIAGPTLSQN